MQQPFFTTTKNKIAFLFAVVSSLLVVITTLFVLLIVNAYIDAKAKSVLRENITQVVSDFQAQELTRQSISYLRNRQLEPKQSDEAYKNIQDVQTSTSKSKLNEKIGVLDKEEELSITNEFDALQQSNQVYARVFLPNGDILFSSDLFDTYSFINPDELGFRKLQDSNTCVYIDTVRITEGEQKDAIVQVGQYCSFSRAEYMRIVIYSLIASLIISLISFVSGRVFAVWVLGPLYSLYQQTKRFSRQVYHELLTPITVALSTAEASVKRKKYKQGLHSVRSDLQEVQNALHVLSSQLHEREITVSQSKINPSVLFKKVWKNELKKHPRNDLHITFVEKSISSFYSDVSAAKLIFRNIISNILCHASQDGDVVVTFFHKSIIITNSTTSSNISKRRSIPRSHCMHGTGLTVVKDLCKVLGWSVDITKLKDEMRVKIGFGEK